MALSAFLLLDFLTLKFLGIPPAFAELFAKHVRLFYQHLLVGHVIH
jgi:hypothetical protein